jgi:hypothetical protein
MKGLSRVVLGSVASAFLGAASFFAIDGLMPKAAEAYGSPGLPGYVQRTSPGLPGYVQDKGVMGF